MRTIPKNDKLYQYLFLLLIFAIIAGVIAWLGQEYFNPIYFVGAPYMLVPFLCACIVEKGKVRRMFSEYHLKLEKRYVGQALKYVVYTGVVLPLLLLAFTYIAGNLFHLENFGRVLFAHENINMLQFGELLKEEGVMENPVQPFFFYGSQRFLIGLPLMLLFSVFAGFINVPFALGEEMGWRGFMEKHVHLTKIKKYLFIGVVWGVWHTPLILVGFNFGSHHALGILMMAIVCIPLSFYFSRALHRTHSLWVPTVMHGLINAISIHLFFQLGNPLLGPRMGLIFVIAVCTLLLMDYEVDKYISGRIKGK